MQQEHRKLIKRNLPGLSRDLDFNLLKQFIIAEDIYPDHKIEAFEAIPDKMQQNTRFLMDIQTRGPKAFGALVRSLRSSNQEHLADLIDKKKCFMPPSSGPQQESHTTTVLDEVDNQAAPWDNETDCYPMKAHPRGIILIINNETFIDKTLPMRMGTNIDVEKLVKLFGDKLGFLVVKKQNLKLEEMKKLYEEFQTKVHDGHDCFVSVILSHGLHDGICAVDYDSKNHEVLSIEDVVAKMDKCTALANKPKVFFTQACRGQKIHKPKPISTDARVPPELADQMDALNLHNEKHHVANPRTHVDAQRTQGVDQRTHVGSDVVIAYPSIKGYAAAREPEEGTWYIKSLCEQLEQLCHKEHLIDILTKVNEKVGEERGTVPDGSVVTQTSEFASTLKKKLYFPPCPQKQPLVQQPTN